MVAQPTFKAYAAVFRAAREIFTMSSAMSYGFAGNGLVQTRQTFESPCLLEDDSRLYQHEAIRNSSLQRVRDGPANDIFPFQAFPCSQASCHKLQMDHFQH